MSANKGPWTFTQALCREVGVELFFSKDADDPNSRGDISNYKHAKTICAKCIHQVECAEWGIAMETHGFWGGLTPKERSQIRGKRNARIPIQSPSIR